jgi:CMP-N-acetylneuraminic acid synthetase
LKDNILEVKEKLINVLITARSGSKRLPGKNIKNLCGKPLIAWSILAAKKSLFVKEIFVSTDSKEIAEIAKNYGALVPRLRDKSLAEDETTSFDTALDFSEYFNDHEDGGEMLLLQPTSPLRFFYHINSFMQLVREKKSRQCVAVRDITKFFLLANHKLEKNKRIYIPNGSMYYTKIEILKKEKTFFSKSADLFVMDDFHSIDIDTQDEWNIAKACLESHKINQTV